MKRLLDRIESRVIDAIGWLVERERRRDLARRERDRLRHGRMDG